MKFKKDELPKHIYGDRGNVIYQLREHFNTTRDEADAILDYLLKEGVVIHHVLSSVYPTNEYEYNPNYDWDKAEASRYEKFRFLVMASFTSNKVPMSVQLIVEWNKVQLDELTSFIVNALKDKKHEVDNDYVQISNLIEIGYPVEVE